MRLAVDHLIWGVPELDAGAAHLAELTGVVPAPGGSHPGFGTRNSLVALDRDRYLEIMAPDPAQELARNRGGSLAAWPHPGLLTFAVRADDLAAYRDGCEASGIESGDRVSMSRTRPDGVTLAWSCLFPRHPTYADLVPFAIDWQGSPHPSASAPAGLGLSRFEILHPEPDPLRAIYARLGVPVDVVRAARPGLRAVLSTPRGDVTLLAP